MIIIINTIITMIVIMIIIINTIITMIVIMKMIMIMISVAFPAPRVRGVVY